jgi:hypothetical protein
MEHVSNKGENRRKQLQKQGIKKLLTTKLCKLAFVEVEHSNTSSGWKYLHHLKFVCNNIWSSSFL